MKRFTTVLYLEQLYMITQYWPSLKTQKKKKNVTYIKGLHFYKLLLSFTF